MIARRRWYLPSRLLKCQLGQECRRFVKLWLHEGGALSAIDSGLAPNSAKNQTQPEQAFRGVNPCWHGPAYAVRKPRAPGLLLVPTGVSLVDPKWESELARRWWHPPCRGRSSYHRSLAARVSRCAASRQPV